ncbi:uncharacterized protein LOC123519411 [Portunus trituberculatus]|uniref:uncharacterized protein LOC123519411 n=1 Tax=Portunus trituberculatus TaxID=210409 RepID=UPI001E1CF1A2|nr:uncharacterized protein LOC123519411 [Portunus trituberculatus]
MTQSVMIRGRYVPTNRPLGLVAAAVVMGIVSGINLGIGVNTYCFSYDSYCDYRKKAYIISGSCFAASSFFFLIGAISLHLKIKHALKRNAEVLAQQGAPPVLQTTDAYPTVVVATQYPATPSYNPAPVGFVVNQQVPPIDQEQRPPPYAP